MPPAKATTYAAGSTEWITLQARSWGGWEDRSDHARGAVEFAHVDDRDVADGHLHVGALSGRDVDGDAFVGNASRDELIA